MRVGLLGGSFDPPHEGHLHLSKEALKRFGLDCVVWLVSPGNPLKAKAPASIGQRMAAAQALIDHPRIWVSDVEARLKTRYTAQTLEALVRLYPAVRFTWLMGADNLAQFHRWNAWQSIMQRVPVGILARPGTRMSALHAPAAKIYTPARLPSHVSRHLGMARPPAWCFVNMPMRDVSSTELRREGAWPS
ncbi:nicotinate-nucleotide adenylyltransferase [Tropicibacter naphthalenivorans]|nr:nicotinate-nucleotide adenylyltransferase [Tropicibacter naphthalenivorans]